MTVLDPTKDVNGVELLRLTRRFEFPDFVKQAEMEEVMRPKTTHYADPSGRRFPCATGASTWLSAAYFFDKRAELHPVQAEMIYGQLQGYAKFFGIEPELRDLEKEAQATRPKHDNISEAAFACVYDDANGVRQKHLPVTSPLQVKQAAAWLQEHGMELPFTIRSKTAERVLEKAAEYGSKLDEFAVEFLERTCGRGVGDPATVLQQLERRVKLAEANQSLAAMREPLRALANSVRTSPRSALNPMTLLKLAETIDDADQALGLQYEGEFYPPEAFLFSATFTKAASEIDDMCSMVTGNVYSKRDLSRVPVEKLAELFGDGFASECTDAEKLAVVAETLPRGDAELFDNLMRELQIPPTMAKSASFQPLDDEDVRKLADSYAA